MIAALAIVTAALAPATISASQNDGRMPRPSASAPAFRRDPPAAGVRSRGERYVYYPNCAAARAAGAAPIRRGEPGYRPALDRDNDGVACEPYRR